MRILVVSAIALASSGCALFGRSDQAAFTSPSPEPAPETQVAAKSARQSFVPAFGVGRPVALVPCRNKVVLSEECRNANERHQTRGEMPAGEEARALTDVSASPVADD